MTGNVKVDATAHQTPLCIIPTRSKHRLQQQQQENDDSEDDVDKNQRPVSYTHLTLPTILLV
eukprot:668726-Amphidinium_carterae.1